MNSGSIFYRWWRILYPVLLAWVLSMLVATAVLWYCQNILTLDVREELDSFQVEEYWHGQYRSMALGMTAVTHILTFAVMAFLYRADCRQNWAYEAGKHSARHWYLMMLPLGICCCFVANGLLNLSGLVQLFSKEYESISNVLYGSSLWLSIVTLVIAAPLAEEFLFRGLCFRRMREDFPVVQSILMSAVLFGAYHGNLIQGLYGFMLGVVFAWSYERFRSLWAPIILHMSANAFSLLVSELPELNYVLGGTVPRLVLFILIFTLTGSVCFYLVQVRMYGKEKES